MNIALAFNGLALGGLERAGLDYTNLLLQLGHHVDIYNLNPYYTDLVPQIPKNAHYTLHKFLKRHCPEAYTFLIKKYRWGKYAFPIIYAILKTTLYIRRAFTAPRQTYDIAIAFGAEINDLTFIVYGFLKAHKKLCWCHSGIIRYILKQDGYAMLYRRIKNVVVISDLMQELVLATNPELKELNIRKIYNPNFASEALIDPQKVQQLQATYGKFVLNVSRLAPDKDHITILQAVKMLKDSGITNKFLIVGDGPTRPTLEKYATELGVTDLCIFCGVSHEVQNYYTAAEVFVHSSPAEGLPLVFIEAMTYGVPIVSTNSLPGAYEAFQGERCAMVVPVADPQAMTDALKTMLGSPEIREKYIKLGCERVKAFSVDTIKNQLTSFLANLN